MFAETKSQLNEQLSLLEEQLEALTSALSAKNAELETLVRLISSTQP